MCLVFSRAADQIAGPMGHNKGKDNVKKTKARREKEIRLAKNKAATASKPA